MSDPEAQVGSREPILCEVPAALLKKLDEIIHPRTGCKSTIVSVFVFGDVTLKFTDAPTVYLPRAAMVTLVVTPLSVKSHMKEV